MIIEDLGLSAWITDSGGDPLPEYEVKQLDDKTIECWIPSSEGTNFEIRYKASKDTRPKLDLRCKLYLDGLRVDGQVMGRTRIAKGKIGRLYRHYVDSSTARLYQFGRRELTDNNDDMQPNKFAQEHLNTIRLEFLRGCRGQKTKTTKYVTPEFNQPIHERAAKKGHAGSVELGEVISISAPYVYGRGFSPDPNLEPSVFIFRYAPTDWLKAREIIPCSPGPEVLEPGPQTGQKRPRDSTPEAIDVDDLETDDDDIVIVKHMIPAPCHPKHKRRKSQAQVKAEGGVEQCELKEEQNEDIGPKREPDSDGTAPTTPTSERRKVKTEKDIEPKLENSR